MPSVRSTPPPIALAARPWLEREHGECAFPTAGAGADVQSCCNPCPGQTYCAPHQRVMAGGKAEAPDRLIESLRQLGLCD